MRFVSRREALVLLGTVAASKLEVLQQDENDRVPAMRTLLEHLGELRQQGWWHREKPLEWRTLSAYISSELLMLRGVEKRDGAYRWLDWYIDRDGFGIFVERTWPEWQVECRRGL